MHRFVYALAGEMRREQADEVIHESAQESALAEAEIGRAGLEQVAGVDGHEVLVGFGVVIPLLPYYALHFDASPFEVTTMMACYSLAQFFCSPLLGRLSDRVGRRPVLLASLCCSIASYVWLGLAGALWMLFAARLLAGAGAGNIAAAQAYINARVSPSGITGAAEGDDE